MTISKEETAIILDRFAAAFGGEMSAEKVDVWLAQIHDLNPEIALRAVDEYIGSEMIAPKVAPFLLVYRDVAKRYAAELDRDRVRADASCAFCGGRGWGEVEPYENNGIVYEAVRPCEACDPKAYEAWATRWRPEQAARRRARRPPELLPADPKAGIAVARDLLAQGVGDVVDEIQPF